VALRKWTADPVGLVGEMPGSVTLGTMAWEVGYALLQRIIDADGAPISEDADGVGVPSAPVPAPPTGWAFEDCSSGDCPRISAEPPYAVPSYPERRTLKITDPTATDNATSWLATVAAAFAGAP